MTTASARTGRPIPSARRYIGNTLLSVVIGSVIVLAMVGSAISQILDDAEGDVDQLLEQSVLEELRLSTQQIGASFRLEFDHAATDTRTIAEETLRILEEPAPVDPAEASRYVLTDAGSYITREVDDGAAMYYSAINEIGPEQKEKALQFSRLDPLLRYVADANPLVAQAYVNTYDTLLRLYPNFPVGEIFPPDTDVRDFNFFYLADAVNNPERGVVWTPAYVDPAGQGWITSVLAPVYRGDFLEGVAAIDIRVQRLVDDILNLPQPFDGFSMLIDADGVIIAMPSPAEDILSLAEKTEANYTEYISSDQFKPDDFDIDRRDDTTALAEALTETTGVQRLPIGDTTAFIAWDTLPGTGWRIVSVTPTSNVASIYEPGDRTSDATRWAFSLMVGTLLLIVTVTSVRLFAVVRRMTEQFVAIDRATARIAGGDFHPALPSAPVAELESTGRQIQEMGVHLEAAQEALRERADLLRANEQRYRAVFENVAEALITLDADGTILDANDAALALFGGPLTGRAAQSVLHTTTWSTPGRHVIELAAPFGVPRVLEFAVTLTAMTDTSEVTPGYTVSVRDLTAAVESQRLLEAAREDAEQTARLKDSLLSSMSHEIRTPMNGVIGILSLMADGELPPDTRAQLDVARRSAEDLLVLLNDVLDLAKLDAEQVRVHPRDTHLADMISGVVQLHRPMAEEQRDAITVRIDPDLPEWIVVDPTRVRQILMNLLNNALKFTQGGTVEISATRLLPVPGTPSFTLRIEVRDSGVGIPTDLQAQLFQPFTQVDPLNSRKYPGTGLGLAIVKRLVELMGGRAGLQSTPGLGSTFWFDLPATEGSPVVEAARPVDDRTANRPLHVLVAEDNDVNRMVLVRMLQRLGHTAVEAVDGRQAIEIAQSADFDVLLMDIQMPVASGIDATRAIRSLGGRHAHVPILAVSANVMPEQQAQYVLSGMTAALSKPITLEQLDAALRRWVAGQDAPVGGTTQTDALTADAPPTVAVSPSEANETLIDLGVVRELRATLGDAGSNRMRDLFPTSLAQRRDEMSSALAAGDHDAARKAAHSIKGMSGSLGAVALQRIAEQMQHADDETFDRLRPLFDDLAERTLAVFGEAWGS